MKKGMVLVFIALGVLALGWLTGFILDKFHGKTVKEADEIVKCLNSK